MAGLKPADASSDSHFDYESLYALQDKVFEIVFSAETEFYLTGGTCLSRFYQAKRYSDDLDFFTNASPRYAFAIRNITSALRQSITINVEVETKNFVRILADNRLRIDFVNDIVYRYKEPVVTEQNYLIDNIENILANKLTAVIGRDNPKDIFDILLIYTYYTFSWKEVLSAAHQKTGFTNEDLVVRLKSFPKKMFGQIKCIDCGFLKNFENDIAGIIQILLSE